ncbi:T9SS type A sorting domain-containing protein [Lutibacter sp. A80]|uniref:chondroitinase-B domain-containing protein n=1 Tax=Lutibacter sp. A80 TaxID=2918453 RepID=UPI001F06E936|nr:chondroitinase-B domain-containing protein [Lutibacter sp. A80]UMB61050.1 T9SS type A sorting domain-containing protein [Lutibacter sp. A80]
MKKKYLKLSIIVSTLLLITQISISQTIYTIDDPEKLEDQTYVAGDEIILANGIYNTDERINFVGNGTAEKPIIFRAESPGGVIFTGGLKMNIGGDYVIVDGFHWKGGYGASNFIQFRNGYDYANYSTIQNCAIDGLEIEPDDKVEDLAEGAITKHRWIVLYGTHNSVINCSFMNKESAGALILAEYAYNAFPNVAEGETEVNNSCELVGHTISNNYFYNFVKMDASLSNSGDSETIRIGTSEYQNVNSGATVSNNYFVEANGENEIITNKSKNNTYVNNTFRRSRGSLVLRHGSRATVEGNYFLGENVDGTGGIRITDSYHNITNNYIQDCITVVDQAKWNNGITFIGGSANADVDCNSTDVSNGYQKTTDINVSNNTIINTNSPLYYNTDKGSTDPTGNITNNLIYFSEDNSNVSDVVSGAYNDLGKALTYSGNIYSGTALGAVNDGFSLATDITATENGEIFTFSGTASIGKGANMDAFSIKTDAMVGYGIGACFLDASGTNITDGDCTITVTEPYEYLNISNLSMLTYEAASYNITVTANIGWLAESNESWITINPNSGTDNEIITISVTENTTPASRVGTIIFKGTGEDDIEKTLTIIQDKPDVTAGLTIINSGVNGAPVTIDSFSKQEVSESAGKTNYASNSLDKNTGTYWVADDTDDDGEYIIYDLGSKYNLDLIEISTNSKSDAYAFQIWISTTDTEESSFTQLLTETTYLFTEANSTEFNQFVLNGEAATYVKIIGFGRFSNTNTGEEIKSSDWTTIDAINFYGKEETNNTDEEDDDNDGVPNINDSCPNTPEDSDVNAQGCSESELDDDNDGVFNDIDQCANSTQGMQVNEVGCFELLANNFKIETVSETCPTKNNGKIIITAEENLNYTTSINGKSYTFNSILEVDSLEPKTYNFCIVVDGESFEQCFNAIVEAGTTVSGKTSITSNKVKIDIEKGTAPYNVSINGKEAFKTMNTSFEINVLPGDLVQVKTSVNCEGVLSKQIDLIEGITAYPNPTTGKTILNLPVNIKNVLVELYSMQSQLISSKNYNVNYGKTAISLENLPTGIYLAKVMLDKPVTIKIIKE